MNAIVTGSVAYGQPDSDIDLVVLVTPRELEWLKDYSDSDDRDKVVERKDSDADPQSLGPTACLRFGRLNLLVVTDPVSMAVWHEGTRKLSAMGPVPRALAVGFFEALRTHRGLRAAPPSPHDFEGVDRATGVDEDEGLVPAVFTLGDAVEHTRADGTVGYGLITEFLTLKFKGGGRVGFAVVSYRGVDERVRVDALRKATVRQGFRTHPQRGSHADELGEAGA